MFKSVVIFSSIVAFSADLMASCPQSSLTFEEQRALACVNRSLDDDQVHVYARKSKRLNDNELRLEGNVCVSQSGLALITPGLTYNQLEQNIITDEEVMLQNSDQKVTGSVANFNLENESAIIEDIQFELLESDVNGTANRMWMQESNSELSNLTFSTCPPEKRDWEIVAEEAELDHEAGLGTFKKTTLRFKNVPLLYIPWIKLPLNNDRRTGFLAPTLSFSDTTGTDFSIPYYWNIAENMDATVTPRILGRHGIMLGTEFRYLTESTTGLFSATYLPDDDRRNRDRSLIEFNNRSRIGKNWIFNTDINNVTDSQYFEDFANSSFLTSTPYLKSAVNISGRTENWAFFAEIDDYQVLSETITTQNEPYQTLPEISYSWFDFKPESRLSYRIDSELINFYREDSVNAWRLDVTPSIEKYFSNSWGWITPALAYRSTHYQFDDDRDDISRNLPIYSIDSGLRFEKTLDDNSYKTLEPRFFYTYVPDRGQQDIPLFDTHGISFGSALLFQTNSFSGADRQSDMNQLAVAVTQRSFDSSGQERWNFTFGQIKYFSDQSVQLNNQPQNRDRSPFIAEFNYRPYNNWNATLSLHYDEEENNTERGLFRIQRKAKNNSVYNFAYRFRRNRIEQLDGSAVLPINEDNRIIARWNYSLEQKKTIEALFGYEYKSCCWAFRLVGRHFLIDETGQSNNGIYAEIQLNGLGSFGRNPRRLLKQSIIGYNEDF
ncbi:LPS-assembly protein LptD [Marinicella sp. W31]|uniref:LPS-assembly protein LptD n=1 Tax=Marinicella sp. W31 TaxID=3023713 RepID=UPI003757CE77